ncbi:hypothetical protein FHR83_007838 [Actinoplanes campanulatus]|uniref:DUF5666 domain-containing protein n=1 Tax=Actinoplanes campanulatus TaxID=113559 RepID=A0A7W5FIV2_9ACTN|nr:hypothetical protein [Actinoplanes campanulatus]MBB3100118.1 hypothetical protein [Actinoplanes campanulatus]GGN28303.1 hypothetical protein GCM10010109_46530 [Actinoplanes campanulatus]GID39070.1 hypothetical protein Aca09nite_55760 [Actinoplanes campanulatus]
MLIRKTVVPVALLLALSAGCANNTAPLDAGGAPEPAPVTSSAVPSAPAGSATLTGTVTAGVEPNCLLLKDGTGDHLLVFDDQKLQATVQVGAEVTVVGKADPGMMTTCMQGEPFLVSSVAGS